MAPLMEDMMASCEEDAREKRGRREGRTREGHAREEVREEDGTWDGSAPGTHVDASGHVDALSSVLTGSFALGEVCGPLAGTLLTSLVGFGWATTWLALSILAYALALALGSTDLPSPPPPPPLPPADDHGGSGGIVDSEEGRAPRTPAPNMKPLSQYDGRPHGAPRGALHPLERALLPISTGLAVRRLSRVSATHVLATAAEGGRRQYGAQTDRGRAAPMKLHHRQNQHRGSTPQAQQQLQLQQSRLSHASLPLYLGAEGREFVVDEALSRSMPHSVAAAASRSVAML